MAERGTFRNTANARQLGRFDGMRWGNITPTDVDYSIDFGGRLFVYAEAKYGNTELPTGQRIYLERTCDCMHQPPARSAVAFIVSHWERGDFYFASTVVTRYRWNGQWHLPKGDPQTLLAGINKFRALVLGEAANDAPNTEHAEWIAAYEREEARMKRS